MKTKSASPGYAIGLFAVTVLALPSSAMLAQTTTRISGTFAPSGNYSVNGNLFLMPLTTMQCKVGPRQSDNVEVSGIATLDGRLEVTMTGRFTRDGPARYTLLEAHDGLMGWFSLVSIKWAMHQGLSAGITYDPNHVYLEIAFEPGGLPPPLDAQRPHEIRPAPASGSEAGRVDKPSITAEMVFRPTVAGLTFAERVAYQYAIEEVYWRHRIWPKDNPGPKQPLDAVISREQIEKKVTEYLRKSQFVTDQRGSPISANELQAEIDRMANHTKRPEALRELFESLGSDPLVIAECLARPTVAERLVSELMTDTADTSFRAKSRNPAAGLVGNSTGSFDFAHDDIAANLDKPGYKLREISVAGDCADDTWTPTTTVNAPDARFDHIAVWTGSEMIVWGGLGQVNILNTGGKYDPVEDVWTATSTANAPTGRVFHSAVWTGSEMIVWGGQAPILLNTGGRYNPITDSWAATSTVNAPTPRIRHSAVWIGSEMVVWGGADDTSRHNNGGRYNPLIDSWTATSTINAPEARFYHTAEWTGSEMIVWGGSNYTIYLNTGGRYDPNTDSWTATGVPNDVLGRVGHTATWSGEEMIVWGGTDSTFNDCNTGGKYNPGTDTWMVTSTNNAPSPRDSHSAVWTGSEMIVWGGIFCSPCMDFNSGGRYNTGTNSWASTSLSNAPFAREDHTAVWAGSEMIVWGGYNHAGGLYFNTGERYCAQSGPTPTSTATPAATATPTATATATPTATARPSPTPRTAPTPRLRPTPAPRP
jgi:N-acetylneuraminic acid mutarotase